VCRGLCGPLLAWLVLGLAAAPVSAGQEVIDRVMAVVAGDLIMLSDVRAARELGLVDAGAAVDPTRAVLSALIDRALVLGEVDRYAPPEPTAQAIDDALRAVRGRFPSSRDFDATLARAGIDERRLREILRQDLRARAYIDQRFVGDTPDRARAAIDEWMAGLRRRAEILDLYEAAR
jgi:hypothetical protein